MCELRGRTQPVGAHFHQWHGDLCQAHGRFAGGADGDSGADERPQPLHCWSAREGKRKSYS